MRLAMLRPCATPRALSQGFVARFKYNPGKSVPVLRFTPSGLWHLPPVAEHGRAARATSQLTRVYWRRKVKGIEKPPCIPAGSVRDVTTPSIRFPLLETAKWVVLVPMIVAPVLSKVAPLHLPPE